MKIAFLGTPGFAVPSLEALLKSRHEIVCIVSQPDKPIGRGGKVQFSPVKEFALKHSIPILQPERISKEVEILDKYRPDILVTCAFGQMLRQNVLDYAPYGVINVHGSLLPKYRGASPIQWAIINGDTETGVTIMRTDMGMDTGDMILWESIPINSDETSGDLFPRMAQLGAKLLVKTLDKIQGSTARFIKQDDALATPAPMLRREHGLIDWSKPAHEIVNLIRGLNPWPSAYFELDGEQIKVHKARVADGRVELLEVQAPNSKRMRGVDFCNGKRIQYKHDNFTFA
ncbi:MAG: methionyl-tRNA formyltransferase [Firmicutes bacterium]|nr:methionyl-tRNA formyltransferase [Bacillota bacterium]